MTLMSYSPCGASVKSKVAMIVDASTTSHATGSYSAMLGRETLTIASGWNCAPLIVVVTWRESPPRSVWMSVIRSEEHTSELHSLMRLSYAVFCLKKKNQQN